MPIFLVRKLRPGRESASTATWLKSLDPGSPDAQEGDGGGAASPGAPPRWSSRLPWLPAIFGKCPPLEGFLHSGSGDRKGNEKVRVQRGKLGPQFSDYSLESSQALCDPPHLSVCVNPPHSALSPLQHFRLEVHLWTFQGSAPSPPFLFRTSTDARKSTYSTSLPEFLYSLLEILP